MKKNSLFTTKTLWNMEKKHKNCISIITIVEWRDHHWIFDVIKHSLLYPPFMYPSQQFPDDKEHNMND